MAQVTSAKQSIDPASILANSFRNQPDENGHFGPFGGRFVPETLMPLILELEREYNAAKTAPVLPVRI